MNKSPIIGFIRYSCRASFSRNDFFRPEYLDYRLNIFRNITLKGFQEQTDKDFNILLLHSKNLPEKYKDIFSEIEENNPFLHNIYIPDSEVEGQDYIEAVKSSVEYVNFCNDVSINFRIDNDDAVPRDFILRLKTFLKPEFLEYVISMPHISIIQRTGKNKFLKQDRYFPSNSMGLAFVTGRKSYRTIMTLGDHGNVNQKYPMVLLPGRGGIQTINGNNIMNALYFGPVPSFKGDALRVFLKENNYADHDFSCLHICKRCQIVTFFVKTYNYLKKRSALQKNVPT